MTKYDPDRNNRRSIRLKEYDYSQAGAYFVTICTQNRDTLLGEISDGEMQLNTFGEIVWECWNDLPSHYPYVELDAFVIMPNHIHAIIMVNVGAIHELPLLQHNDRMRRRKMSLPKVIGYAKMNTAKQINQLRNTLGKPVWQRNYYEHIIRNESDLNSIRQYIVYNPAKWEEDEDNPHNISRGVKC